MSEHPRTRDVLKPGIGTFKHGNLFDFETSMHWKRANLLDLGTFMHVEREICGMPERVHALKTVKSMEFWNDKPVRDICALNNPDFCGIWRDLCT